MKDGQAQFSQNAGLSSKQGAVIQPGLAGALSDQRVWWEQRWVSQVCVRPGAAACWPCGNESPQADLGIRRLDYSVWASGPEFGFKTDSLRQPSALCSLTG